MNPLAWLNPGTWLLYGSLVAALALGAWRLHHVIDEGGYERAEAEYQAKAFKASELARSKERELNIKNLKVSNDYQTEKKRRIADGVVTAGKLRDLQAVLSSPVGTNTTAITRADDPRDGIIYQCSSALIGMDGYAKGVAAQATALQSYAREVCLTAP